MGERPDGSGAAIEGEKDTVHPETSELFEAYREEADRVNAELFE